MDEILTVLEEFKVGKERLLSADAFYAAENEIQRQIEENYDYILKFKNLKEEILFMIQNQLGIASK
ncbi:hypothetical protein BDW_06325 [Bdellovibrio bacteriovorus W]|nr:hypothetical protein BDW_06325 [Bdellovibrio bacteriovorus W]